ncbi:hypothetical protein HU200_050157 [Digitaria exilis]|uniref:RING-CH-type domain-containing protein n=1 Tax=Digitaria exilis TaxID=1010633 RepID=A0A835ARS6_9POAL|nr:hypothetical protein HU200_050157 [Digitaria exilis]
MDALLLAHRPAAPKGSLKRLVDEQIEAASAACCRICFEPGFSAGNGLISPCKCKGTLQFVHRSCLDHWRAIREGTAFSHCTTCKAQFHLRVRLLEEDRGRKTRFRLFVARDILLVFLAIQTAIAAIGCAAYLMDKHGQFRNRFADGWVHILSKHPVPFYYCVGVVVFFALVGLFGLILNCSTCSSSNNSSFSYDFHFPRRTRSSNCSSDSHDGSAAVVIIIIIFAILGIVYAFVAATIAVKRILQRHYHILTKKELTKEYVVEDLREGYTAPTMDPEHERRLRMLKLM